MKKEDIVQLSRECGFRQDAAWTYAERLERFADKIAAKEREACAQVCESTVWTSSIPEWREMTKHDIATKSMLSCAEAIRARGQKEGA